MLNKYIDREREYFEYTRCYFKCSDYFMKCSLHLEGNSDIVIPQFGTFYYHDLLIKSGFVAGSSFQGGANFSRDDFSRTAPKCVGGGSGLIVLRHAKERQLVVVPPNVRAKRATTAGRAGQQAQNGPKAQRLMAGVACRWRSA